MISHLDEIIKEYGDYTVCFRQEFTGDIVGFLCSDICIHEAGDVDEDETQPWADSFIMLGNP